MTSTEGTESVPLGRVDDGPLPRRVEIAAGSYFLVRDGTELRLLSSVCPHKGGIVQEAGAHLQCPRHGWTFDPTTGRSLNAPTHGLASYPVVERDGVLYAELPARALRRGGDRPPLAAALTFQFHAHACLEVRFRDFRLLTDPWLNGPAFYGSWVQYPPPRVNPANLRPDAILISHEHSDHFHPPTLELFPRTVPVYVPDFPNRRLPDRLARLGFRDVRPMPFGETVELADDVTLTCFEPASVWNDAIALFEAGGFRYLNINDAGLNHKIASLVAPVDLVSSAFSPGASGYPATWRHIPHERKVEIMEEQRSGYVLMLRDVMRSYGARYLLPFASFFTLWHPDHRVHHEYLRKNTPADVAAALADLDVEVLDLFPGEVWNAQTGKRTRVPVEKRDRIFDSEAMAHFANETWDESVFRSHFPRPDGLTKHEVSRYLLRLNETPDIQFCEDLTCLLRGLGEDGEASLTLAFAVTDRRLAVLAEEVDDPNLTIELPLGMLERIVRHGDSWDEPLIGYWCRLDRSPDTYHAGFWRLLQAPYFRRPPQLPTQPESSLGADSTIAELLERYGTEADLILRRYGLYCFGCSRSPFETIRLGAQKHGLTEHELERLVTEVRAAVSHV